MKNEQNTEKILGAFVKTALIVLDFSPGKFSDVQAVKDLQPPLTMESKASNINVSEILNTILYKVSKCILNNRNGVLIQRCKIFRLSKRIIFINKNIDV